MHDQHHVEMQTRSTRSTGDGKEVPNRENNTNTTTIALIMLFLTTCVLLLTNLYFILDTRKHVVTETKEEAPREEKPPEFNEDALKCYNTCRDPENNDYCCRSAWDYPADCYEPLCLPPDFPPLSAIQWDVAFPGVEKGSFTDYKLPEGVRIYNITDLSQYNIFLHAHPRYHAGVVLSGSKKTWKLAHGFDNVPLLTPGTSWGMPAEVWHVDYFIEAGTVLYLRFAGGEAGEYYMPNFTNAKYMVDIHTWPATNWCPSPAPSSAFIIE